MGSVSPAPVTSAPPAVSRRVGQDDHRVEPPRPLSRRSPRSGLSRRVTSSRRTASAAQSACRDGRSATTQEVARLRDLLSQLDTDGHIRGRQWEQLSCWFLENDPVYKSQITRVWPWKSWVGRWGTDAGIDLVAELRDGSLMAVQAKAYAQAYWVTKADIDTFLSESARAEFSRRLVIATTNHMGPTALRTLRGQKVPAKFLSLAELELAEVDWPASFDDLRPRRLPPKTPRPHQQAAVDDVCRGFDSHDRGKLVMACGTGKTLVGLWVAERLQAERTLVLFPSLTLIAQTLREWSANATDTFEVLAVCSDQTVHEPDAFVESTSDLAVGVTTYPQAIRKFLGGVGRRVVFATYQSSRELADAMSMDDLPPFDLAIADEAHRCAGPLAGGFATILDESAIRARRRLFMTATPRYYTGRIKREAAAADYEVASMDDTSHFGPVLHELTFPQAIERDLLSDYRIAIVGVDDAMYREYAQRGAFVTTDGMKITDARTLAGQIGVARAMRRFDLRRMISFHNRISSGRSFSSSLPDVVAWMPTGTRPSGRLWSRHISGELASGERDSLLTRFRELEPDERGLLANSRCLSEGVDVPSIDGIAFIDPRRSQIDIVQALGRAIRKSSSKTIGTIVLPVFIDTSIAVEAALASSAFAPVWAVLRALRAHDSDLGDQLDNLRRQLGRRSAGQLRLPGKIMFDLPLRLNRSFVTAMRVRVVEAATSSFEYAVGELRRYSSEFGHVDVPRGYVASSGFQLGMWAHNVRNRKQVLSEKRRRLLEAEGFTWDPFQRDWELGLAALRAFKAANAHPYFRVDDVVADFPLGAWGANRRRDRNRGNLPQWKIDELDRENFVWSPFDDKFTVFIKHLAEFKLRTGSLDVARGTESPTGYPLGKTVSHYRNARKRGVRLTPRKIAALDALGFIWDKYGADFQIGLGQMRSYQEMHGSSNVPLDHVTPQGFRLGQWLLKRRQQHWSGELARTDPRFISLDELGVDWGRKRKAHTRRPRATPVG